VPLSLPILTFHDIDQRPSVISFPPQIFDRGIAKLHASGYRTLSLVEIADLLRKHEPFPARSISITFDDGCSSVYEEAFPVLTRYGMSATVFLTVGKTSATNLSGTLPSLEGRSMLSWPSIREMVKHGIVFGAHTLTHPDLTELSLDRVKQEIIVSKDIIENALGTSVSSFAYPYGCYNDLAREIVKQNFTCACSDKLDLITTASDLYALERVDSYYLRTYGLFDLTLTRMFPWYVKARAVPRSLRRCLWRRAGWTT
jgi:peptidoglycan/xylan/chitin deacetylase (PgdA/CDA1 family)